MRHGEPVRHSIENLLAQIFLCGLVLSVGELVQARADTPPSASANSTPPNILDLALPSGRGHVIEAHPPASSSAPTVVYLQEAHANYEAQQHLIAILEQLIQQHGLRLILVEGGAGNVSLSYLRRFGSPENRVQVAEKYLKLGLISGEEYFDITSEAPLALWGVEQPDLYRRQGELFTQIELLRDPLRSTLDRLQEAVDLLKPILFHPALIELQARTEAFDRQAITLSDYVAYLRQVAVTHQPTPVAAPHLARFLEADALERVIDLDRVQEEQQAVLNRLSGRVDGERLKALLAEGRRLSAGGASPERFYARLAALAAEAGLALDRYPHLARYLEYVTLSSRVSPTALLEELRQFEASLQRALTSTPESRQLLLVQRELDLITKWVDLQLSPEEHAQLPSLEITPQRLSDWARFLNDELQRTGWPIRSFDGLGELAEAVPILEGFYQVAQARDEALVNNAAEKLRQNGERLAVLITGGFHGPRITQLLIQRGLGVVSVAVQVGQPTDQARYRAVLRFKRGAVSLDELSAAAASPQLGNPP